MAEPTTKTVTLNSQPELTRRHKYLEIAIQLTDAGAPTYTTNGLTIDLTTLTNNLKVPRGGIPLSAALPANKNIIPQLIPSGYTAYLMQNGTAPTLKNYLLKIFRTDAGEHASGALDASLFASTVLASPFFVFRFIFKNWQ